VEARAGLESTDLHAKPLQQAEAMAIVLYREVEDLTHEPKVV